MDLGPLRNSEVRKDLIAREIFKIDVAVRIIKALINHKNMTLPTLRMSSVLRVTKFPPWLLPGPASNGAPPWLPA